MNFSDPEKVLQTIRAGDDAAWIQSENRRRINEAANGCPPLSADEAKQLNVRINVNWGELPVAFAHARRQYNAAINGTKAFFRVSIPTAPVEKQTDWELFITSAINKILKKSKAYRYLKKNQIAALVAHGIAPQLWYDRENWLPCFVDIADLRIPTDTQTSFENLEWFAVRHRYTPGELVKRVWNDVGMEGWDKKAIADIIKTYKDVNYGDVTYDWETNPEAMAELIKQNFGFYSSDAMPTISLWHFYYLEDGAWYMCVVPDTAAIAQVPNDRFLYTSDKCIADDLSQLLHVQFGDLNNKTPQLFHSVRSLGFLLMEPCFWSNLTRCRYMQHGHETMNVWYRVSDPAGRARAQKIELFDRCIVPEGVSVVPQTERHQVDKGLIESIIAQTKQLQQESSVAYTQELDRGTQKEQTAYETAVNVQKVNAMMTGLLESWFGDEVYADEEICRRLCLSDTMNEDAKRFQKACQDHGIPREYVNVELWEVEPEMPMGAGNPTMATAEAQQLLQIRPLFDPTAQQEILHDVTAVFTGNVRKAARWVPLDKNRGVTDAQRDAEFAFGVLMQGVPVRMKEGLSPIEQVETLLGLMAGKITGIQQSGGMTDEDTIRGLTTTQQYIGQLVGLLAQNPQEKQRVKQYSDALGKLANETKALAQRLQQQKAKEGANGNGEAMAKVQALLMQTQAKAKVTELNSEQKRRHKELSFQSDQRRKDLGTLAELKRANARTIGEIQAQTIKAANAPQPKQPKNNE